ncbi:hypothetical protein ACQP2X_20345 [Actinoplanes sp. CA-131856]
MISNDPRLAEQMTTALARRGARSSPDGVSQLQDDQGRFFTFFGPVEPSQRWDWQDGHDQVEGGGPGPDLATATACWVECRWEGWFADLFRSMAAELPGPAWVLDNNDVLWPADEIDPARISL